MVNNGVSASAHPILCHHIHCNPLPTTPPNPPQINEDLREWSSIFSHFLHNPLWPLQAYLRTYALPGLGLFTEGYVLFAIGNLKTLFSASYPSCWATFTSCSRALTQSTDYLQIVGIVGGQVGVGVIGDALGRRWGLIQDAAIMLLGVVMLVGANGPGQTGWVVFYAVAQVGRGRREGRQGDTYTCACVYVCA